MRVPGRIVASAAVVVAAALSGCGGPGRQDRNEPRGTFPVDVTASFPTRQRLAQASEFRVVVRNTGSKTIPNVAVTIQSGEPGAAHAAAAFAEASTQQGLADPSRPVWILDYGPRGGTTAYVNTWALGALRAGQVRTFVWHVTAIKPGTHTIKYTVAAGLNGKARAQLATGGDPTGTFTIDISRQPADARVAPDGRVIVTPNYGTGTTPAETTPTTPAPAPAPSTGGSSGKGKGVAPG